jgi:hypothetical protein
MRSGAGGDKALAPPAALVGDFLRVKRARMREGLTADRAHLAAYRELDYRRRFLEDLRGRPAGLAALRRLLAEARERDVYFMCMCPYRTPGRACHSYLLLDLARELDPTVKLLPEPRPRSHARPSR